MASFLFLAIRQIQTAPVHSSDRSDAVSGVRWAATARVFHYLTLCSYGLTEPLVVSSFGGLSVFILYLAHTKEPLPVTLTIHGAGALDASAYKAIRPDRFAISTF